MVIWREKALAESARHGLVALSRNDVIASIMKPSESNSAKEAKIEAKPVKQIVEPTTSVGTKASVKSALDKLHAQAADSAPVTDQEGKLVGRVSKDQMNREVGGRGHDPTTSPVEPEVEKEAAPYCFEDETIGQAEKVMREAKVDELSVVSGEKKLVGKATLGAIKQQKKKAEES
jgi:CBS domain-containing protein